MQAIHFFMVSYILSSDKFIRLYNCTPQTSSRNLYNELQFRNSSSDIGHEYRKSSSSKNTFHPLSDKLIDGSDNILNANENTQNIYYRVLDLLIFRIETWLKDDENLESISKYLGFPSEIENIINVAITELFYLQRRGRIRIDNLVDAFFYLCDIEHMRNYSDNDKPNITDKFKTILKLFEYQKCNIDKLSLCVVQDRLKMSIRWIVNVVNPSTSITIPLMKNRMFVDKSNNEIVNKLQQRFIEEYRNNTTLYERETSGDKIIENHLNLLSKVIPDIFGFVYNHFELLSELLDREFFKKEDEQTIQQISEFVNLFMQFFINRYAEFKIEVNKEFLDNLLCFIDAISDLVDFIDSSISSEKCWQSISHISCKVHMWKLMNNTLGYLLNIFDNENIEEWKTNRTLKIEYPDGELNKSCLVKLMINNTKNAYEILNIFSSHFTQLVKFETL